jgi:hypothetical protein
MDFGCGVGGGKDEGVVFGLQPTKLSTQTIVTSAMIFFIFTFTLLIAWNSNTKCPNRPTQNDFGTAFVPSAVGAAYL